MSTRLEMEIAGQGAVLRDRNSLPAGAVTAAAEVLVRPDVTHLVVAARGSSDNAARFGQYLFGDELRLQVGLAAPWLFRDPERAPHLPGAAVMCISQSGQSPDVVAVLAAARRQERPTVAVTADADSPLARQADVVVALGTDERSVAATKTYIATLHALVQVAEAVAPDRARREWLHRLPSLVDAMASQALGHRDRFDPLLTVPLITVIGRGLSYSAACETALKVRELGGVPAEAFSPPDLRHGPIAALDGRGAIWSVDPHDTDLDDLDTRAAFSVRVGPSSQIGDAATVAIPLPADAPAWVRSLLAVIPAQAAGLRLAELRGIDVDRPHGLTKITLTR
jgi:glutamine---fructose-6-phosphate transaminase (isomerizing)